MIEMIDLPFFWKLYRIEYRHEKKNCKISYFKINSEWSLVCLWTRYDPFRPEFLEIRRNSNITEVLVSGKIILMRNSETILQKKFTQLIEAGSTTTNLELEYTNVNSCNSQYIMTGTLTIPAIKEQKECSETIKFESLQHLSTDFERLLDSETTYFSDVNLKCEEDSIAAHKNILSARSPVFAKMFSTEMREKQENEVVIGDISSRILKIMLIYLYTGKTGELCFQTASELLFAADKYQLQDLEKVCIIYLKSCISAQNVWNILVLGHLHSKNLKDFAFNLICNSNEEFELMEKTEEWEDLRKNMPGLAMEVLISLVKSKDKKLKLK